MISIAKDSSDFAEIRQSGCVYVDKTAYFHRLITTPGQKCLFFSRPRRFGKSLMLSTFKAIFEGRRELFKGLAIDSLPWNWQVYPVLHFDLSTLSAESYEAFCADLKSLVRKVLENGGVAYDNEMSPAMNFAEALESLAQEKPQVVVLIDEYDAPVGRALSNPDLANRIREHLANFYIQLKAHGSSLRFLMMTGVSKFSKLSVFSSLNNIVDISLSDAYAAMLGYTENELDLFLREPLASHARVMGLSKADYRAKLKKWYNGYRFWKYKGENVYNPVSIGWTLSEQEPIFKSYWSSTGRSSALMNYLKRESLAALDYEHLDCVTDADFDVSDLHHLNPKGVLFHSGYLTIKNYDLAVDDYILGVPNEEVRQDLAVLITSALVQKDLSWTVEVGKNLMRAQWNLFFEGLKALFAALPYGALERKPLEYSFQRCLCTFLAGLGFSWVAENVQANGRADIVVESTTSIYIFELKVDASARDALSQIKEKGYDAPYRAKHLPIYGIGLSFNSQTRCLFETAVERLSL